MLIWNVLMRKLWSRFWYSNRRFIFFAYVYMCVQRAFSLALMRCHSIGRQWCWLYMWYWCLCRCRQTHTIHIYICYASKWMHSIFTKQMIIRWYGKQFRGKQRKYHSFTRTKAKKIVNRRLSVFGQSFEQYYCDNHHQQYQQSLSSLLLFIHYFYFPSSIKSKKERNTVIVCIHARSIDIL